MKETAKSLYSFFKKKRLLDDRSEYDVEDLLSSYPGLSEREANKLFVLLQRYRTRPSKRNPKVKWYAGVFKPPVAGETRKVPVAIVFPYSGGVTERKFGKIFKYAFGPFNTEDEAVKGARHQGFDTSRQLLSTVKSMLKKRNPKKKRGRPGWYLVKWKDRPQWWMSYNYGGKSPKLQLDFEEYEKYIGPFTFKRMHEYVKEHGINIGKVSENKKNPFFETAGAIATGIVGGEIGKGLLKRGRKLKRNWKRPSRKVTTSFTSAFDDAVDLAELGYTYKQMRKILIPKWQLTERGFERIITQVKDYYGGFVRPSKRIARIQRMENPKSSSALALMAAIPFLPPNPQIPERVLEWREKLRKGAIMRPKTFKGIKRRAGRGGYYSPSAVAGTAYWITLLRKYLDTHPSDRGVKRILDKFLAARRSRNPGERWHKEKQEEAHLSKKRSRELGDREDAEYYLGKAVAHESSAAESRRRRMRNPRLCSNVVITERMIKEAPSPEIRALLRTLQTTKKPETARKIRRQLRRLGFRLSGPSLVKRLGDSPRFRKVMKAAQPKRARRSRAEGRVMERVEGKMPISIIKEKGPWRVITKINRRIGTFYQITNDRDTVDFIPESELERFGLKSHRKNPSMKGAVKIYDDVLAIEARKGSDSKFPNDNFRHDFKKSKGKASIFGLPNGSLLIKGNKKLWKRFNYE